ncbi:GNAT family N-acetyltransferase [Candidatus Woesearchaeota archaeon]|nr:GNAT family N-acetyltransferase [Candidatus Woesearchaeota archaeon]
MDVHLKEITATGIKLSIQEDRKEVARAFLYLLYNDLNKEPFGFMEDVFVEEAYRSKGYGSTIIEALIAEAKKRGCYKLIGTSRHSRSKVHELYKRIGFEDWGVEFRMNLTKTQIPQ